MPAGIRLFQAGSTPTGRGDDPEIHPASPWNRSVQKIALTVLCSLSDHPGILEAVQNLLRMDPGNPKYKNLQAEIRTKTGRHSTEK